MPLFGAHMSVAGGLHRAAEAAQRHACDALQLFTKNSNQWQARELTDAEVDVFRAAVAAAGLKCTLAHDSYLINLASPDESLYNRSVEAFAIEVERAERLGLDCLVTHPGSATDGDVDAGLRRVARGLDAVHARFPKARVRVLLETTAGQGHSLGHRFEHLATILAEVQEPDRLGICLDTCHVFAAGYALAPAEAYRATMAEFDRVVGLDRLRAFHVNDSKKPLGSRVDRHEHLGQGCLGPEPFRLLVNDRRFRDLPMILETPKEGPDGEDMDTINLAFLRGLVTPARKKRVRPG